MCKTVNALLQDSLNRHGSLKALSNWRAGDLLYWNLADRIARYHLAWQTMGLPLGTHIAVVGHNSAEWAVAFLAAMTYGAVVVTLPPHLPATTLLQWLRHSEAVIVLADAPTRALLPSSPLPVFALEAQDPQKNAFREAYPDGLTPTSLRFAEQQDDDLTWICYTESPADHPRAVMIPQRALWNQVSFAREALPWLTHEMEVVALLPTWHPYGLVCQLLYEVCTGLHVTFLHRALGYSQLLEAVHDIRPHLLLAVPALVEKLIYQGVWPSYNKPKMRTMRCLPMMRRYINRKFCKGLTEALGGRFRLIICSAPLHEEVETVMHELHLPFTVGYGKAECAPLISYADPTEYVATSCGKIVPHMEMQIVSPDPTQQAGALLVRGRNVMLGYYKNADATHEVLEAEGWLHTGVYASRDNEGNLFLHPAR